MIKIIINFDKNIAKNLIETYHYSHKIPQAIKYRFGFYYDNELIGCAIYSIPANQFSFTSIWHNETQHIGIELSRVVMIKKLERNILSYCLSQSFKWLKLNSNYEVILSYADANFSHAGYIYQALNFIYLGKTNSETRYLYNGQLITRRGLGRRKNCNEKQHVKQLLSQGAEKVLMQGKHKYILLICKSKKRKKELLSFLTSLPYPKIKK